MSKTKPITIILTFMILCRSMVGVSKIEQALRKQKQDREQKKLAKQLESAQKLTEKLTDTTTYY